MSETASLLLLVGLTLRLMRLVQVDEAGEPLRKLILWAAGKVGGIKGIQFFDRMLDCPFCIGFWISAATGWSWLVFSGSLLWKAFALPFALSWVAGHISALTDTASEDQL